MSKFFTDEERVQIAKKQYEDLILGDPVEIDGGKIIGYVSQIIDRPLTGEDTYVITDTYVPETASLEERSQVKEVTILYQGSTEPIDWIPNNISIGLELLDEVSLLKDPTHYIRDQFKTTVPQLISSADTLKDVMELYPNAIVDVYGHSLGSADGQYAIADLPEKYFSRIGSVHLYQGPNIYTMLTKEQQINVKKINSLNKVFNYVDEKDLVARLYSLGQPTIGFLILVDSIYCGSIPIQHKWGGYQFEDGKLLTRRTDLLIEYEINNNLKYLSNLKVKFMENNGGNLSSSQEIFLDATEAYVLVDGLKKAVQQKIENLEEIFIKDMQAADILWHETLEDARFIGTALSEYEIMESLENGGATIHNIFDEPNEKATESLNILKGISESYDKLLEKTQEAITKIVENDEAIARELGVV